MLACLVALPACASSQIETLPVAAGDDTSYEVAVFGDMPYVRNEAERATYLPRYHAVLDAIGRAPVEFAVHLGDYTTGPFCGDSTVELRYREFQSFGRPLIFVPGDNDWTDCARGGFDPLERLAKVRAVFMQGDESLGRARISLTRQSSDPRYAKFRENVRWQHGRELYVGLHVVGSRNNWGHNPQPSAEYVERNAANLAFLRESFALARAQQLRGVAIFIQANPGWLGIPELRTAEHTQGFDDFLGVLQELTMEFGKPVVLFHGDTHYFRIDKPMRDARTWQVIPNFTRVEPFGHPNYSWVQMRVDPADPELFSFRLKTY